MATKRKAKTSVARSVITLEQRLPEIPNRDPYSAPTQHLVKDGKGGYLVKNTRRPSKTLLVNQIRKEVDDWRASGYTRPAGISATTQRLLDWWFDENHRFADGTEFKYYFAQREAIESIIFLYEVRKIRDAAKLVLQYMDPKIYKEDLFESRRTIEETVHNERLLVRSVPETGLVARQELPKPEHYRYAIKMATGSGKTLVMAMTAAWSYFHKKFEPDSPLSKTFLVLAPNVIVFERLKEDFGNGEVFQNWDLVPPDWRNDWQMTFIMRGDTRSTSTDGTLYLTNIHQLYESRNGNHESNPVVRLLGPKPKEAVGSWEEEMLERVKKHKDLLIINDEAHHVHDTELQWYKVILNLQENLQQKHGSRLSLHLDFSATPKDQNGTFFPWIINDYPLAQAIEDRIVKAPLIVHQTDKADPGKYTKASVAYAEWIEIAVSRWREHHDAYGKIGAKPVLFIMAENTKDADDIFDDLKKRAEFKGNDQVLLIHTDKTGEVKEKDLNKAREAARSIDLPNNKIRVIVSVMMLREGWDVRNVSVILGLRPFTAKANILPEQAVGRGLRLIKNIGPDYIQIVEIIGTQKFEEFVKQLEVEGVGVGVTRETPPLGQHVHPMNIKAQYNIEIPLLSPTFNREFTGLDASVLDGLPGNPRGLEIKPDAARKVSLVHATTETTVGHKDVAESVDYQTSSEIISHLTNLICKEARIVGQFATVYPIVEKYVREIFFGQHIDLEDQTIRRALNNAGNAGEIVSTLAKAIGNRSIVRTTTRLKSDPLSLLELEGFFWKRDWTEAEKTVFNLTPCFNDFEKHFAQFLDQAADISKFAKLAESYTKFSIEYLNHKGALALYYPDFVAEQKPSNGETVMWLIETKGWELPDVELKDKRAVEWCRDASSLTKAQWRYLKVKYQHYVALTKQFTHMPAGSLFEFLRQL